MITIDNYFNEINPIDVSRFPDTLQKGHEFVLKITKNGAAWTAYHASEAIKKTVDIYLSKLNEFATKKQKPVKQTTNAKTSISKKELVKGTSEPKYDKLIPSFVERIPEELRFIKRFVNLDGKVKTKEQILTFINSLQKAILEKRIRKTSSYADEIRIIQRKLIDMYNNMKAKIEIKLKPETYESLKQIAGEEKVMPTVRFIKRYISLNGKTGMKQKADNLYKQITRMVDKMKIPADDPYLNELHQITKNLEAFLNDPSKKVLAIERSELNGLEGILGCACQQTNGLSELPAVMNSMDFANLQFDTLGFTGKWLELIGDPSRNFTAMVFGLPKMGKSYLCVDFAGYLARNHGKVLYVAKEEGLDYTLQQKLNDKNVKHPNLDVASSLPADLSKYDFIFLDSVTKLKLSPDDLSSLRAKYPSKSFIFIFQTTKDGRFRGANSFQHDVDVVIEVPEKGKAVQMGRFNQGGGINIFDEHDHPNAA